MTREGPRIGDTDVSIPRQDDSLGESKRGHTGSTDIDRGRRTLMKLVGAGSAAGLLGTGSVTAESTDATDSVGSDPYEARSVEFPDDAGVVNVTDAPYNAAGDGTTDDTAAIQAALDDYPSANKIIYLPDGTYLVSDTIEWPDGGESGGGDDEKRTILQGQSRANTTIVLEDDAEEFQNPTTARQWSGLVRASPSGSVTRSGRSRSTPGRATRGRPASSSWRTTRGRCGGWK
jgi:hypothetical protein